MSSQTAALKPLSENPQTTPAAANFDPVARIYRWAEYLARGSLLKRTREHFLPRLSNARQALLLGDGDGRFAAALLAQSPDVQVRAIDTSPAMLALLRARCAQSGAGARLLTEQASALEIDASPVVDLVVTHFFLDCLSQSELNALTVRLAGQVKADCLWVVSDFGLPHNRFARPFAAAYIRLLYLAFRVLTGLQPQRLPDPQHALTAAGFSLLQRTERLGGFLYSELWQLRRAGTTALPAAL